jgi:hypothetical protein
MTKQIGVGTSSRSRARFLPAFLPALGLLCGLVVGQPAAQAAKPEDVFKGKIIITKNRLPMKFSSSGAFVAALQKGKTDKIWPTEEKGDDHGIWNIEYVAVLRPPAGRQRDPGEVL